MTDIYNETYNTAVRDNYHTDEYEHRDEIFYGEEYAYHQEELDAIPANRTGAKRVVRLMLVLLFVLLLVAVIIFGVIPYVEAMNQSPVPLPPAVQT